MPCCATPLSLPPKPSHQATAAHDEELAKTGASSLTQNLVKRPRLPRRGPPPAAAMAPEGKKKKKKGDSPKKP